MAQKLTPRDKAFIAVYESLQKSTPDACDSMLAFRLGVTRNTILNRRNALKAKGVTLKPFAKPGWRFKPEKLKPVDGDPNPDRKDITTMSAGSLNYAIDRWSSVRAFIEHQIAMWRSDVEKAGTKEFRAIAQKHVDQLGYLYQAISGHVGNLREERKRRVTEAASV